MALLLQNGDQLLLQAGDVFLLQSEGAPTIVAGDAISGYGKQRLVSGVAISKTTGFGNKQRRTGFNGGRDIMLERKR